MKDYDSEEFKIRIKLAQEIQISGGGKLTSLVG